MRSRQWISTPVTKAIVLVLGLVLFGALVVRTSRALVAQTQPTLEATIFSYDGHDFVRTKTTLHTTDGKSAVDTKLDHNTLAYKALIKKHSYIGESTVFGRKYDANYAPLISDDGRLTGALFVAVAK
jgi:cache 3/cache 2 fusion protein